jgi:hypothetical protein
LIVAIAALALLPGSAPAAGPPPAPTPVNTAAPSLTGTPIVGATLRCSSGSWSGNPSSYAYAWLRDGAPIAGQSASSYVVQSADWGRSLACEVTATNSGGEYTIGGLPNGSYQVRFNPSEGNYLPQFYNSTTSLSEATPVSVTLPNTISGINAVLAPGGQISGKVTAESSGAPLPDVEVCAYEPTSNFYGKCVNTNDAGEYAIIGLPSGSAYEVSINAFDCERGCAEQNYVPHTVSGVSVTAPNITSDVDAQLQLGGRITGKVMPEGSMTGLEDISACTWAKIAPKTSARRCGETNAAGEYAIVGLPSGTYEVSFDAEHCVERHCTSQNYVSNKATGVSVMVGSTTTNVNAALQAGGQISGTVNGAEGGAGVIVCAFGMTDPSGGCVTANEDGGYTISALSTQEYRVDFRPFLVRHESPSVPKNYLFQQYDKNPVSVIAGSMTSNVDATMSSGGVITGKVTAASNGVPIPRVFVCASHESSGGPCEFTNSNGEYTIDGLPSGSYTVSFSAFESNYNYVDQYYNGSSSASAATPISVTAGSTTPNVDAALAPGGQISGRVTAPGGVALADVWACAYEENVAERCALSNGPSGSASATSSPLAVPATPLLNAAFAQARRPIFDAKSGELDFFFTTGDPGVFTWSLDFKNADVGFADSLDISNGQDRMITSASAVRHPCHRGTTRHGRRCVRALVPFASGSQTVAGAGIFEVRVHPDAKAIKALRTGHTLHVSGSFSFQSSLGGSPVTRHESLEVHPARKHTLRHTIRRASPKPV